MLNPINSLWPGSASVHDGGKISSHLWDYSMTSVSSTVFFIAEINQSWNHNKAGKATKYVSSTSHQHLQDYSAHHSESWDIHLFSESSSELSCLLSAKENEEKWHDMSNWNSMHNHQKKILSKRTESSDFSHCCSSFQVFICELNSVLNHKHRKHVKQITKSHKKEASS